MATRVQHNRKQQNIVILNINSDHRVITFSKGIVLKGLKTVLQVSEIRFILLFNEEEY